MSSTDVLPKPLASSFTHSLVVLFVVLAIGYGIVLLAATSGPRPKASNGAPALVVPLDSGVPVLVGSETEKKGAVTAALVPAPSAAPAATVPAVGSAFKLGVPLMVQGGADKGANSVLQWTQVAEEHASELLRKVSWRNTYQMSEPVGLDSPFTKVFEAVLLQQLAPGVTKNTAGLVNSSASYRIEVEYTHIPEMKALLVTSRAWHLTKVMAAHSTVHSVEGAPAGIVGTPE